MTSSDGSTALRDRVAALLARVGRRRALLAGVAVLLVLPPLAFAVWTWRTAAAVDLGRIEEAAVVYAAGQVLTPGVSLEAADVAGSLRRLGYRETSGSPDRSGQFRRTPEAWEIHLRRREDPRASRPAMRIRIALDGSRVRDMATADGPVAEIELEPEALTGVGDAANQLRHPVPLAAIPRHLVQAVLAAEDHRFYEHHGIDVRAVGRAIWVNLRRRGVAQGGSTLTQQLVKNLVLTPKRTLGRKVREAAVAVALERRYSKDEILSAYLNGIYLGQHGGFALYGVGAAARSYFGKDVDRLTLAEAATLAGIIRAPNTYSPVQRPERARERRNQVLRRMHELGMLDDKRLAQAQQERVVAQRGGPARALGPYFADWVRAQVEQIQPGEDTTSTSGLRIYTTLHPVLQRAAEGALARGLDRLEGSYRALRRRDPAARLQGAIVVLDPRTGEILAMAGGRDYGASQFNRAALARRQPGSAFKPFVYLAALGWGPRGEPPHFTAVSRLEDQPLVIGSGRTAWSPRNYEGRYEGMVTVRQALEHSLNAATVWMADAIGYDTVIATAREVGFTSPMQPLPAVVLGSAEVTPLELASAYAVLANGGDRVRPMGVRAVVDREGGVSAVPPVRTSAIRPEEAFLITHLLQGVVDRGTGASARALGVEGVVAGKTGTTNEGRDAWFVGYTPRLVTLVWVGFDEREVLRLSGAQAALPIWADFMRTAMQVVPGGGFPAPDAIAFRDVDPTNGKLATAWCPVTVREAFLASTEPRDPCQEHGPADAVRSLLGRFFGASPAAPAPPPSSPAHPPAPPSPPARSAPRPLESAPSDR